MAKAGHPTPYNGIFIQKALEYLDSCKDDFKKKVVKLPKAAGLALALGVSKDTLYEWAKVHKEFSVILLKMNQMQEQKLVDESLAGNYNPHIAKLVLGKHGYHDSSRSEVNVKIEKLDEIQKATEDILNEAE
jgi:hypothetical protein